MSQGFAEAAWLDDVRRATATITSEDLNWWQPPRGHEPRRGAVLMLFGEGPNGPDLLLTERAHHMRSHPGQVSFPGGSVDDGESSSQAALREAREETGVDSDHVDVIGELPHLWLEHSNFSVTTVVGWAPGKHEFVVNADEVHAIWPTSVAHLLDPAHRGTIRHPSGLIGPGFLIGDNHDVVLWGFTAGIIDRFFGYLGWTQAWDGGRILEVPGHMLGVDTADTPDEDPPMKVPQ